MIAFLQLGQHAGNRFGHFTLQVTVHFPFEVLLKLRNTLAGNAGENVQQVRNARFVLHVVAHNWRLIAVGHCTFDLLDHRFRIFQQTNHVIAVVIRLRHFLGRLQQGHHARTGLRNERLRNFEHITINRVEALGDIAAQLQVLFLVFTNRNLVSLVQQDIGRHQYRVVKQTGVDVFRIARRFIFELGHTAQFAEIGVAVQRPTQLCVLRYVGLNEDGALFRVNTAGQIQRQGVERRFTQRLRVLTNGDGVLVNDAIDAVVVILHVNPLTQRTHVVTDGQFT